MRQRDDRLLHGSMEQLLYSGPKLASMLAGEKHLSLYRVNMSGSPVPGLSFNNVLFCGSRLSWEDVAAYAFFAAGNRETPRR